MKISIPLFLLLVFILPSIVYFGLALVYFPIAAERIIDRVESVDAGNSILWGSLLAIVVGGLFVGTIAFALETLLRLLGKGLTSIVYKDGRARPFFHWLAYTNGGKRGILGWLLVWLAKLTGLTLLPSLDLPAYAKYTTDDKNAYVHQLVGLAAMHLNLTFGSLFMLAVFVGLILAGEDSHTGVGFQTHRILAGLVFTVANFVVAYRVASWAQRIIEGEPVVFANE